MSVARKKSIRWLTFDVLGTCVDWRKSLREDGAREWKHLGLEPAIDWGVFALSWESAYASGISAANSPGPWIPAAQVIRNGLDEALASIGLDAISDGKKDSLCKIWDRLRPWSDVEHGLRKIRQRGLSIATLSNFGVGTLEAISGRAGLNWNRILSAESVKRYKPDPAVYEMAVEVLEEDPDRIMMVAAHSFDLTAAREAGFMTAFVIRAGEDPPPVPHKFNLIVANFDELQIQV